MTRTPSAADLIAKPPSGRSRHSNRVVATRANGKPAWADRDNEQRLDAGEGRK